MAKSKRCRAPQPQQHHCGNSKPGKGSINATIELTQEAIDRHWDALPPQAKSFIQDTKDGMFPLSKLIAFWGSPSTIECTRGGIAGSICGATWYLALVYLKLNRYSEARSLTINGAFIHQCYNSSIEYIKSVVSNHPSGVVNQSTLPYFIKGCQSIISPDKMRSYIETYLPKEYTQMMTSFANLSSKKNVKSYVDQISDDWNGGTSSSSRNHKSQGPGSGIQIKIVLVDDVDANERHSFDIGSSTTLKSLFNDYADKRGVSLRSLRFSFNGKTLFLSSAGNKSPSQLGLQNEDVIMVHDTSKVEEPQDNSSEAQGQKKKSSKKSKSKRNKSKSKKRQPSPQPRQQQQPEEEKTLEEYKVDHSKLLTKIHEEASTQFKSIRQRLNNLAIERSQPKNKKSKRPRSSPKHVQACLPSIDTFHIKEQAGKAGKSHYIIQVGEISNLYKTTKHSSSTPFLPTLDLHGYTRDEAVNELDDKLKSWVDTAMTGSYPFVQSAVVVCGCGNQILSETVAEWIRRNDNVRNAPRASPSRRVISPRAA